jgi:hypothetical protein
LPQDKPSPRLVGGGQVNNGCRATVGTDRRDKRKVSLHHCSAFSNCFANLLLPRQAVKEQKAMFPVTVIGEGHAEREKGQVSAEILFILPF